MAIKLKDLAFGANVVTANDNGVIVGPNIREANICGGSIKPAYIMGAPGDDADAPEISGCFRGSNMTLIGGNLCGSTLTDTNFAGTLYNSGTVCGGTIFGSTLTDTNFAGTLYNSGTVCGGTICGANLVDCTGGGGGGGEVKVTSSGGIYYMSGATGEKVNILSLEGGTPWLTLGDGLIHNTTFGCGVVQGSRLESCTISGGTISNVAISGGSLTGVSVPLNGRVSGTIWVEDNGMLAFSCGHIQVDGATSVQMECGYRYRYEAEGDYLVLHRYQ